ncbi:MAG: glutamate 5-kinase [Elusimicrobia bacterium]|nr:glutamate 5-kinase [Elusimicrobiota bacterium]
MRQRIVVKIGTAVLTKPDGEIHEERLDSLVDDLAALKREGHELLVVTSGAIGAGFGRLGLGGHHRPHSLRERQAAAAIGQVSLMERYQHRFTKHRILVAQVLLTRQDLEDRQRYLNIRSTILTLLELGVVPVINENDTVAVEEIQFGDNDTLAAIVASKVEASLLIFLTDVPGLCVGDPRQDARAEIIREITQITPAIEAAARRTPGSQAGTGGMYTKVQAAKIATASGVRLVIADGRQAGVLQAVVRGRAVGTTFLPQEKTLEARKRWIAFGSRVRGQLHVDQGAAEALVHRGKSLLPSGITQVEGEFTVGDPVSVVDPHDQEIARGLVSYASADIHRIKGQRTTQLPHLLGESAVSEEVIHRDNLVILSSPSAH